jgi:4-alpha-glucanotransferase
MSVADLAIFPLQDLLGLGSRARMNVPGTATGNWCWRVDEAALTAAVAEQMGKLTAIYGRSPAGAHASPFRSAP